MAKLFTIKEVADKGIPINYQPDGSTHLLGVPVRHSAFPYLNEVLAPTVFTCHWLDPQRDAGGGLQLVEERDKRDKRAIVLIRTAEGAGGKVALHPNTMADRFDPKAQRVYREPSGPFPPPGVEVLAQGHGPDGGWETLVLMYPGASFRIHRTGDLQGAAPQLRLQWDGTWKEGASKGENRTRKDAILDWGLRLDKFF